MALAQNKIQLFNEYSKNHTMSKFEITKKIAILIILIKLLRLF